MSGGTDDSAKMIAELNSRYRSTPTAYDLNAEKAIGNAEISRFSAENYIDHVPAQTKY